jgi:hypothetical protein
MGAIQPFSASRRNVGNHLTRSFIGDPASGRSRPTPAACPDLAKWLQSTQVGGRVAYQAIQEVRFVAPAPLPADLLAEARQHRDAIGRALAGPADLGELPAGPCRGCCGGAYWRVSVLSGGSGPWHCGWCDRPDSGVWMDGHAASTGRQHE